MLPALPTWSVQDGTPVAGVTRKLHSTLCPAGSGPDGIQDATPTLVTVWLRHVVVTKPLPALAASGTHEPMLVQFWTVTGVQVVALYELAALAVAAVQLATAVGPVVIVWQDVVFHALPELPAAPVQDATPVQGVLLGVQVVAVQLLPELATAAVHDATPVGPVLTGVQVVAV